MEVKKILLLGASDYYIDTIKSVKELGYEVHVLDKNEYSLGFKLADKYDVIDFSIKEDVYQYARKNCIDAIMPLNDFGTRSAFYASQKLGLKSPSYLSGIAANDKGIMRDVWKHENLPQPKYIIFDIDTDVEYIVKKIGFPLVIKPTDTGGAGRGVTVAYNKKDLSKSIEIASEFAFNNRYIAESFIDGIEITVESLVYNYVNYPIAFSDKVKAEGKSRVATMLNYPSLLNEDVEARIKKIVAHASDALGINYGATHTELIVSNDNKVYLIEMGARPGGSHIQGVIVKETSGIDFPKEIAKILCDEKPILQPMHSRGCTYYFFNPKHHGVIKDIVIDHDNLKGDENLIKYGITAKINDSFCGLENSMKRIGYIISKGSTRECAIQNAHKLSGSIQFIIG